MTDKVASPVIRQRFFDANGNPLALGKLYTYVAGSAGAVNKATYVSAAGAANTNPVIMDANGYADVFFDTGAYLLVLKDALGNLIWTRDGVIAIDTFTAPGPNALSRPVTTKLAQLPVTMEDYNGISDLVTDNTVPFARMIAQGFNGLGGVAEVRFGDYRLNGVINTDCVILRGNGGCVEYDAGVGFHGVFAKGLRPYNTGAGTATLTVGGVADIIRHVGLHDLAISGDRGDGTMAAAALSMLGGLVHCSISGLNLRDGIITWDINPTVGVPITCNFFTQFDARNQGNTAACRTLRVQRNDVIPDGDYYTANHFINGHFNGPLDGYCIEVNGHASPGAALQIAFVYCDVKPAKSVLLAGNATIECWDLTLDPGTTAAEIIKTDQAFNTGDISGWIRGFLKHGGQNFKWGTGEVTAIPANVNFFFNHARLFQPFVSDLMFITDQTDPFNITRYWDETAVGGPYRLNGLDVRFMRTTQTTNLTDGAVNTLGGASIAKNVRIGGDLMFYCGNVAPVGTFSTAGTTGFRLDTSGGVMRLIGSAILTTGSLQPTGGTWNIGDVSAPYSDGWFVNAIHVTSDETQKNWLGSLTEQKDDKRGAYIEAGKAIMNNIGFFQWLTSVAEKGDSARWHAGIGVQSAVQAFVDNGLETAWGDNDPSFKHAFFSWSKWEDEYEDDMELVEEDVTTLEMVPTLVDMPSKDIKAKIATEEGEDHHMAPHVQMVEMEVTRQIEVRRPVKLKNGKTKQTKTKDGGSQFMVRPSELLMFLTAVNHARISDLEAK